MIEGRRQAARKRRDSALGAVAFSSLVVAVALLVTSSAGDLHVRELAAYRAGALALAGWAIAIGLAYVYRPPR